MGNYASSCTLIIPPIMKTNKASRVIFPSGEIRQYREQIKAAEVMLECPSFFLVNSRSLNINRRFSPLSADEDLEPGNIYIMFSMRRVNSMVTPADMALFWMAGNNAGKRISGRITPDTAASGDATEAVEAAEEPRMMVDVPEFSYRMVVCRSRKPFLDTIMEDPIGAR
ncbi:hypothetical protein CTI12_AA556210 [Artemisia annua]|uniref:Uncharacterized protein n=1 Tax=Artemisia annua TaxID=35608 RepID=A0A2U1KWN3_ARTAN|nr:hypothetical protein CTI12_AA556210 [Artemisia annua]